MYWKMIQKDTLTESICMSSEHTHACMMCMYNLFKSDTMTKDHLYICTYFYGKKNHCKKMITTTVKETILMEYY